MRAGQQSIIELRLHSVKQCDYLTGADNHSPKPMLPWNGGIYCSVEWILFGRCTYQMRRPTPNLEGLRPGLG